MRVAMFVLLMVYCVSTSEGLPSGGNIISGIHRQNAQFGESVRDWVSNIKARILVARGTTNPKVEDPNKLGQGKFILINLNTLKFNPQKDWGFRIGNWYYIKHDENSDKTLAVLPGDYNYDDLYELYDESKEGNEDLSAENGGEREDEQTSNPLEPDEVSIRTESPNNAGKMDDENSIKGPQSAEVLTPKVNE